MQQRVLILEALRQAETQAGEGERKAAPAEGSTAGAAMARSASKREAASDASGKPVEAFRRVLEEKKDICWADLVPQFRENYYEAYDEMASALFSTDDPFVIYNTVRYADFSKPQEVAAHVRFIAECDAEKHQVALRALARTKVPKLLKALNAREDLPESVKDVLTRKEEEAIEAAVAAAEKSAESEEDDDSDDQPKAASRTSTKARSTRTKAQSKEDAE